MTRVPDVAVQMIEAGVVGMLVSRVLAIASLSAAVAALVVGGTAFVVGAVLVAIGPP